MVQGVANMVVRTERETPADLPVAAVIGNGVVSTQLIKLLSGQGIKVLELGSVEDLSMVEAAKYVFLFLDRKTMANEGEISWRRLSSFARKFSTKLTIVSELIPTVNLSKIEEEISGGGTQISSVEIRSEIREPEQAKEVAGKIARLAFSSRSEERLIIGNFSAEPKFVENPPPTSERIVTAKNRKTVFTFASGLWILVVLAVFALPFVTAGGFFGLAARELVVAKEAMAQGNFLQAKKAATGAKEKFTALGDVCVGLSFFRQLDFVCEGLTVMELVSDTVYRGADLQGQILSVSRAFFSADGDSPEMVNFSQSVGLESQRIEENLGFLEASLAKNYPLIVSIGDRLGISRQKIDKQLGQISKLRFLAKAGKEIGPAMPEVLGVRKRTYLLVFQNSAELRATGGFIGSYAIVHVDGGRLLDYKINDIYSSDGQLKGRVSPPDEILHYLGQPSWFMRDANFSPDFPLSAERLAWFLEKETGQNVDGVIGINVSAVEKILRATGPIRINSAKEPITADNFFQKAEYASEINFFPGSTLKRDFLGEVAEAILARIVNEQRISYTGLAEGLADALLEKDIMFYFNSGEAQRAVEESGFSGSIVPGRCAFSGNCLMVVEDNFGANKANYFIRKNLTVETILDKGGGVVNSLTVEFQNQSPNDSWPGGKYKNYLRFLIPERARFLDMNLGDDRQASVSSVLTADVLAKVSPKDFLVFSSKEQVLTIKEASVSGMQSFGVLVEIPVKTTKTVTFKYALDKQLDFQKNSDRFEVSILKQSGSLFKPLTVKIGYPTFLVPKIELNLSEGTPIVYPQELIYNTVLDKDKTFEIKFEQK